MNANTGYLRRIGYREAGPLLIGKMLTGISYVERQPDHQGNYKRLAFLPFDTLALEVSLGCSDDLRAEILVDTDRTY